MGRQTIRVRRVGSVTFGVILVIMGIIFLAQNFLPHMDCRVVLRFWPIVLIGLGIEVLLGSRQKNVDVLDGEGKIVEQNKVVYDVPAILLTVVLLFFSMCMALMDWALVYSPDGYFRW